MRPTVSSGPRPAPVVDPALVAAAAAQALTEHAAGWLRTAQRQVAVDPRTIRVLFPAVGRQCGSVPLSDPVLTGWGTDDGCRALLLASLALTGDQLVEEVTTVYRHGDRTERRGVLYGLCLLELGAAGLPLVRHALGTGDPDLLAAALGPYAAVHLDQPHYRLGVLRCVAAGVDLGRVHGLAERADAQLRQLLAQQQRERGTPPRELPALLRDIAC